MARHRSREAETEDVNQRRLQRGAVVRRHIGRWAVGATELAPGVVGDVHLHPTAIERIRDEAGSGSAHLLVMTATAASIATASDYVTFDSVVAQQGFDGVLIAGESWVHPITGVYALTYEHAWDSYEAGGTIELELDGAVADEGTIATGSSGAVGRATILYRAAIGQVGKVKVSQASGSSQTCDATLWVGITDPYATEPAAWVEVFAGDVWGLAQSGGDWWTTEGHSGITVSHRDGDGTELDSFEASAMGPTLRVRGITFDGLDVWLTGWSDDVHKYDTAGNLLASFDITQGGTLENTPGDVAFDGTDLWVVGDELDQLARYSTAGTLLQTVALPTATSGDPGNILGYTGLAFWDGHLYVADHVNSRILKVDPTTEAVVTSIPLPAPVTEPHGLWISPGGTLYVAKDGVGVYRRTEPLT